MFRSLPTTYLALIPAFAYILLLFGCGGEEIITNPISGSAGSEQPEPQPTNYFPMTLGSRWVYRNPDSSEWSREVTKSEVFDAERYHSFSYNPPIQDSQLDALGSAEYLTYFDRLVRRMNLKDINDAVSQIILESGGESPNWTLRFTCVPEPDGPCKLYTDIFDPLGILSVLFHSKAHVVWHSKLTPLRYPLFPSQTYTALDLRMNGRFEWLSRIHAFESRGLILGKISGYRELVETRAGAFEDCLKIQYEAMQTSFTTEECRHLLPDWAPTPAECEGVESAIREELTDLLKRLVPKLGLQTVWLAPGVGPVKIEGAEGTAVLIDYEIK